MPFPLYSITSGVPRRLLIGRERFQESDQLCSALRRCQTAVRLHAVAGHYPVGVRDEALEIFLIPNEVGAPHSARIRVVWQRPCFSSDDASHVRAEPIVALLIEWHVRQALLNISWPDVTSAFWGQFLRYRKGGQSQIGDPAYQGDPSQPITVKHHFRPYSDRLFRTER